jgi:hypothetical protein
LTHLFIFVLLTNHFFCFLCLFRWRK